MGIVSKFARRPVRKTTSFGRTTTCGRVLEADLRGLSPTKSYRGLLGAIAESFADLYLDLTLDPKLTEFSNKFGHNVSQVRLAATQRDSDERGELFWCTWIHAAARFIWDRRFFVTSSNAVGVALSGIAEGDHICILLGCVHSVVVRWVLDHYALISDAYVDEYMHREGMEALDQGKFKPKEFKIR